MYMLIGLVSLILCVRGRWVDETGCLRAIGFLNQYNKVKLTIFNENMVLIFPAAQYMRYCDNFSLL